MIVKINDKELLIHGYGKSKRSYFPVFYKFGDEFKEIGILYLKNVNFKIKTRIDEELFLEIRNNLDLIAKQLFGTKKMFLVENDYYGEIYRVTSVDRIKLFGFKRDDENHRIYHNSYVDETEDGPEIIKQILVFSNNLLDDVLYLIDNIYDDAYIQEQNIIGKFAQFLKSEDENAYKKFSELYLERLI
jgi:predicted AlkP superfamily phosphohydrolase/phosphomutase